MNVPSRLIRADPPDAAAFTAREIALFLNVFGERKRRLDDLAIEVGDVKTAVRSDRKEDRPKPTVGRSEKLAVGVATDRFETTRPRD